MYTKKKQCFYCAFKNTLLSWVNCAFKRTQNAQQTYYNRCTNAKMGKINVSSVYCEPVLDLKHSI